MVKAMERVAQSTERRALLLLGAYCLEDRERQAAIKLLSLLEQNHPARRLLDLTEGEKLPHTILDDLGDARIRKAVRVWLNDKIAKD